ncbi:MAG: hypothetical protein C3F12_02830 [Candidatus Methylomirabilota bacterium]|nr:MAG: hypothetical protein C3F12_02830 [candidate division NC10 bacterium]
MGCSRSIRSVLFAPLTLLFFLFLSSISVVTVPGGSAFGQERPAVRSRGAALAREQQGGVAEAARVVAERLAAAFPRVQGLIIGFEGDLVLIDRGSAEGVVQGMELDVFREGEEFKHPFTGEVLGRLDKDLGTIRILHVRERYAEAAIIKKAEKTGFRKGDRVRVSMARMIVAYPNVDTEEVGGIGVRSVTKDLAAALVRTGRFELIDERQLRSLLMADKELKAVELADPRVLKQLADKGKIQVLLLSRLTPLTDGVSLDVQAYSTLTGHAIVLASAQIQSGLPAPDTPSRTPQPTPAARSAIAPPQSGKTAPATPQESGRLSVASMPSGVSEPIVLEPAFEGVMTAMGAADLNGDGKSELLLVGSGRLAVFRFDNAHLRWLGEYPLDGKDPVVTLEATDVTGDGGAEIIMTLSRRGRVHALIVQWAEGKLRLLWETPDLILRPLSSDGKTVQLFGQAVVPGDRGAKPIHRYMWDGQRFHAGPTLDVPSGLSLLQFTMADLAGDGAVRLMTFLGGTTLEIGSQTGALIGSYRVGEVQTGSTDGAGPRILVDKQSEAERSQIILRGEQKGEGSLLGRWTGDKAARLVVLKWDDAGLHEVRQIPVADGALADYAVADLGEKFGRRLLALVVKSGTLGLGAKSEIRAFRIR